MDRFDANYERLLMTPGPTMVDERVRQAMAKPIVNPDLDPVFFAQYRDLCRRIGQLMGTQNDVFILSAEGLLGLEAAVCSLVEPGTQVLVLANGYFGEGFGSFVEMYGGECIYLRGAYDQLLEADEIEAMLRKHPNIRVATLVHCETPSGLLNPMAELLEPLKARGIITIVDAVSSIGGEPCAADDWGVDIMLGGSQKALSAPPGLALVSVSPAAWEFMLQRKQPIRSYYLNLLKWRELWLERSEFPYTPSISDIYALDKAVELLFAEGTQAVIDRHFRVAEATRNALRAAGFVLFPQPGAEANTVTAFRTPPGIDESRFRTILWEEYGVMMAGSWGDLAGKVWRIGHMGYNARIEYMMAFFAAFEAAAEKAGIPLVTSPLAAFCAQL
ncbi:MAG TPA: alanine--glyoxylate aminotransferase family protein [Firmicutes bacterium]|nr:alanine--glyoxylate aminotransferase family protein [Bacillota bacterium]